MDQINFIKMIYQYRELLKNSVKKDIRGRYKRSFLGILWSFLNPLLMVTVYALVFPIILKVKQENYIIFLIMGIIPWNFFSTTVNMSTTLMMTNSNIIKKIYFPREILPLSLVISNFIDFLFASCIIIIFLFIYHVSIGWAIIILPVLFMIQFIFTLSIVLIISSLTVYLRDLTYIVNFILMLLFYLTPVVFSIEIFPSYIQNILYLNPVATIIESYRNIILLNQMPDLNKLIAISIISFVTFVVGYLIFSKLEKGFAEEL